jgi:hypothetical protein
MVRRREDPKCFVCGRSAMWFPQIRQYACARHYRRTMAKLIRKEAKRWARNMVDGKVAPKAGFLPWVCGLVACVRRWATGK